MKNKLSEDVIDCQTGEIVVKAGTPLPLAPEVVKHILYGLPLCPRDCARQSGCVTEAKEIAKWEGEWKEHWERRREWTSRDTCRWLLQACDYMDRAFAALDEDADAMSRGQG